MQMVMFLKENGEMIKQMVGVFINILMEQNMKVIGKMIYNMEKELKLVINLSFYIIG
jgi:hypothetical protein